MFRADGAPAERFDALWYYNSGFLLTRLMSYLGGFETPDADDTSTKKDPVPSEKATKPSDDTTEDDT